MQIKSRTLESKLHSTTLRVLVGFLIVTVVCFIIGLDKSGLFPSELIAFSKYAWWLSGLTTIFSVGLLCRSFVIFKEDSE